MARGECDNDEDIKCATAPQLNGSGTLTTQFLQLDAQTRGDARLRIRISGQVDWGSDTCGLEELGGARDGLVDEGGSVYFEMRGKRGWRL